MISLNTFPQWDVIAEQLRTNLGYAETTIERTYYTYTVFVNDYCTFGEKDAIRILTNAIDQVGNAYENGDISKDKLIRMRRLAFRMIEYVEFGKISWHRAPLYGKKFGNNHNEALLMQYLDSERSGRKHAESMIKRDEHIIRKYILFSEERGCNVDGMDVQGILDFLAFMKKCRPAGVKSVASALKHFYIFLIDIGLAEENILLAIRPWDKQHKKIYGIFSAEDKENILNAIDDSTAIGKRDKAIMMLAMDCGLRSSDICNLKLNEIDWKSASVCIVQQKTLQQVSVPFSKETGNAIAEYILNARGTSDLQYVFLKGSYWDSAMTSSLLCTRIKKYLSLAGINRSKTERLNMHTFRRSLGTELIDVGENLEMVAQILGHRSKEATKGYISISERLLRECPLNMPCMNKKDGGV